MNDPEVVEYLYDKYKKEKRKVRMPCFFCEMSLELFSDENEYTTDDIQKQIKTRQIEIWNLNITLLKWHIVWYNLYRNEKEGYNAGT